MIRIPTSTIVYAGDKVFLSDSPSTSDMDWWNGMRHWQNMFDYQAKLMVF